MKVIRCFYPKFFSLLFLLYFLGGTATLINASQEKLKNPKVLVVNSYHPGYKWSDDIMLGIRDAFVTQRNVELIIEHLDTKRHFDKPYLQQIEELFRRKYRSTNIDIIITSDDNALDFIIGIRKELFPNTPLIFCGIDHIKPERIAGQKPIYGIEEADSTASTIDLIISMHPDLESITFIADDTSTGNLMIEKTKKIKSSGQKNINFNYLTGMTLENLQSTLRKIPNKTVLFYLSFIRDKNGNIFSIENSMKLIANSANVPVYCSWGFRPGTGVLGGNILSGYKQGEISATIARRLLDRNSVEDIPAIQQAPLVYKFDYQAMIRFNIDDSSIPQNSLVFNKPSSFYSDNKKVIWITLFTIFLLILFIMFLFLNIGRRKKAETELQIAHDELGWKVEKRTTELSVSNKMLTKEIKERKSKEKALADSEEKHRSLIENLSDLIIILDKDGINVWNSPSVRQYGIEPEDAIGRPCDEYVHPDDLEEFRKLWDKVIANPGKIFIDEHRATGTPENPETWIYQYNTMVYLPEVPGINGVVAVCRNVTEQKLAEEALRENEKYLQQAQKIESIGTLAGGIAHD
ncbi:MAG: PAS domain S-box protein, partial [bacterium]|nr:PAS domain S-box protein [bacterium]